MKKIIASGLLLCSTGSLSPGAAAAVEIRFAFIGATAGGAYSGAVQGVQEANLQGRFLGQSYSLQVFSPADLATLDPAAFNAALAATDAATVRRIGRRFAGRPVFNLSAHDDSLRENCADNLLHVIPSARMLGDAAAQWRRKNPEAAATAAGWHPDFVKFAARDLNKRYKKNHGVPMDQYAWAGWAAVKMSSDSIARKDLHDPAALLQHLKTDLSFDGQKGLDLSFRDTGQLRQILLLVSDGGELLGEAPVRGVAPADAVDSLGRASCYTGKTGAAAPGGRQLTAARRTAAATAFIKTTATSVTTADIH